jgi:hypothetical protein
MVATYSGKHELSQFANDDRQQGEAHVWVYTDSNVLGSFDPDKGRWRLRISVSATMRGAQSART